MTKYIFHLCLILITACRAVTPEKRKLVLEDWKGHTVEEIENHPYFKNLPKNKKKHEDGLETWIYRDQSQYQFGAYCQSLGGCMGLPYYNCDTAFSIKDGKVLGVDQSGSCPPIGLIEVQKKSKE